MGVPESPLRDGTPVPMLRFDIEALLALRRSVRAFLPEQVPRDAIEAVLCAASRAPSGNSIQPWRVHVVAGEMRDVIVAEVCAAYDSGDDSHESEYSYYPSQFFEPYLERRRRNGWGLYGLLGKVEKAQQL